MRWWQHGCRDSAAGEHPLLLHPEFGVVPLPRTPGLAETYVEYDLHGSTRSRLVAARCRTPTLCMLFGRAAKVSLCAQHVTRNVRDA